MDYLLSLGYPALIGWALLILFGVGAFLNWVVEEQSRLARAVGDAFGLLLALVGGAVALATIVLFVRFIWREW